MRMDRRLCGTRISTVDYQLQDEKKSQIFLQDKNGSKKRDLISHGFCFHVEGECNQTISGHDKKKRKEKHPKESMGVCRWQHWSKNNYHLFQRFFTRDRKKKYIRGAWALLRVGGQCVVGVGGCTFRYLGRKILFKNNRYLHDKFLQSVFFSSFFFLVVRLMDNGCTCCVVGVFGY